MCANYTGCMIGYHVVSVILDAYVKGIKYPKYNKLFDAMKHVSNRETLGIPEFKKKDIYHLLKSQNLFLKHWSIPIMIGVFIKWQNI